MERGLISVRRLTLGDGEAKICIPVTARTRAELEEQIRQIRTGACEMLELRADYFMEDALDALSKLREEMPEVPLIFTCRTKAEGGEKEISWKEYAALNQKAAESGAADFVDLELNRGEKQIRDLIPAIRETGTRVLLSYHDFKKTPGEEELLHLFVRMQELGADMTKAALMPRSRRDVLTVLQTGVEMKEKTADRPYILLSMGELGKITRLAGTLTGSAVTFASAGATSAPGQLEADFVEECRQKL